MAKCVVCRTTLKDQGTRFCTEACHVAFEKRFVGGTPSTPGRTAARRRRRRR